MDKPHNVQIEFVRGCNRRCDFCAIDVVQNKRLVMDMNLLADIAQKISVFDPIRIEFAMRGEPLIAGAEKIGQAVSILRMLNPKSSISLSTNGDILFSGVLNKHKYINAFFQNGGNTLIINNYDAGSRAKRMRRMDDVFYAKYLHPEDGFSPWSRRHPKERCIVFLEEITQSQSNLTRKLTNQGGNIGKVPKEPLKKMCVHPFREISIFADGGMPICCRDWSELSVMKNILHINDLSYYWNYDAELNKLRRQLLNKDRSHPVCRSCDYFGGMRQGLIKKGIK